jgi:hypothetical protein
MFVAKVNLERPHLFVTPTSSIDSILTYSIKGISPFTDLFESPLFFPLLRNPSLKTEKCDALKALLGSTQLADPLSAYQKCSDEKWNDFSEKLLFIQPNCKGQKIEITMLPPGYNTKHYTNLIPRPDAMQSYRANLHAILNHSLTAQEIARNLTALYRERKSPPHFPLACAVMSRLWELIPLLLEIGGHPGPEKRWYTQSDTQPKEGPFNIFELAHRHSCGWEYLAILTHLISENIKVPAGQERAVFNKLRQDGLSDEVSDLFFTENRK